MYRSFLMLGYSNWKMLLFLFLSSADYFLFLLVNIRLVYSRSKDGGLGSITDIFLRRVETIFLLMELD